MTFDAKKSGAPVAAREAQNKVKRTTKPARKKVPTPMETFDLHIRVPADKLATIIEMLDGVAGLVRAESSATGTFELVLTPAPEQQITSAALH